MDWTFPHKTCEAVRKHQWVEQPYSCFMNILSSLFLFYYFLIAKTFWTKSVIFSFFLFELFHAYSHAQHLKGQTQVRVIHLLSYLFNVCLFFCLKQNLPIPRTKLFFLLFVLILDVSVFLFSEHKIFQVLTGFLLLISIVVVFLPTMPRQERQFFVVLVVLGVLITLQIMMESMYCETWMSWHPLPYHIVIEFMGLIAFILLAHILVRLEQRRKTSP